MHRPLLPLIALLAGTPAGAQDRVYLERAAIEPASLSSPASRVAGDPGRMRIVERTCPVLPEAELRQRIVDIAAQEWAYFGFSVVDQTNIPDTPPPRKRQRRPFRRVWLDASESGRVADSIAGYWSATPDGPWILGRQNEVWNGSDGIASRWRDPWSAAFISWVMCEAGLGDAERFKRAIAHHTYIDQAIVARDTGDAHAAYVAYDIGEQPIEPGDMLCAGRRPFYTQLDERRAQLGVGIRSHCDIVVQPESARSRILVIGGNVRGAVSLKLHAAEFDDGTPGGVRRVGRGARQVFAHLKLRAGSVGNDALERTPTSRALAMRRDAITLVRDRLHDDEAFDIRRGNGSPRQTSGPGSAL